MDILAAPQTWLIVGTEMFNDERPEDDTASREQFAHSFLRTTAQNVVVNYQVPQTLQLLDQRIDRGDVQWVYVGEDKQRFRFAALSLPAFTNDRGQELAAVAVISTRKYKTGREGAARALCRAIAEILGPAAAHLDRGAARRRTHGLAAPRWTPKPTPTTPSSARPRFRRWWWTTNGSRHSTPPSTARWTASARRSPGA